MSREAIRRRMVKKGYKVGGITFDDGWVDTSGVSDKRHATNLAWTRSFDLKAKKVAAKRRLRNARKG